VDKDIFGGISRFAKRKILNYDMWLVTFLEKFALQNFLRFGLWGVCRVILQLWKKKPSLIRCLEDKVLEVLRSTQNLQ
jgi:hypothetical protein